MTDPAQFAGERRRAVGDRRAASRSGPPTREIEALNAVTLHHRALNAALHRHAKAVCEAGTGLQTSIEVHRSTKGFLNFCRAEILPHTLAEEQFLYPLVPSDGRGALLVSAMRDEHRRIVDLITQVDVVRRPADAGAAAYGAALLFAAHAYKGDALLLPHIMTIPGVSLADAVEGRVALIGYDG